MNVGILTGGGDCPGLNAVIRAVVRRGVEGYDMDVIGIRNGWEGLITGQVEPLTPYFVTGILPRGGTILGTSRTNPFKDKELPLRVRENYKKYVTKEGVWPIDHWLYLTGLELLNAYVVWPMIAFQRADHSDIRLAYYDYKEEMLNNQKLHME